MLALLVWREDHFREWRKIIKTLGQEVTAHLRNRKGESKDLGVCEKVKIPKRRSATEPAATTGAWNLTLQGNYGKGRKHMSQNFPTWEPRKIRYLCNKSQCHRLRVSPGRLQMEMLISQNVSNIVSWQRFSIFLLVQTFTLFCFHWLSSGHRVPQPSHWTHASLLTFIPTAGLSGSGLSLALVFLKMQFTRIVF